MSCLSWRGIFHKNWEIKLKFQMGGLWRNRGPPSFFSRKGALTHHRVGTNSISFAPPQAAGLIHSVVPPFPTKSTTLWEPFCGSGMPAASCALRGGLRPWLPRLFPAGFRGIVCSPRGIAAASTASRQCHSTCGCCCHRLRRSQLFPLWKQSAPCPHKPAAGNFGAEMDGQEARPFSLLRKRNRKRKNEVNKRWRFIIWKRRWSAGAQVALP